MSKIIYYMGAGASYGKKEAREVIDEGKEKERLLIHEGLPVINEIGKCLLAFKEAVANAPIDTNGHYLFLNKYRTSGDADTADFGFQFTSRLSYAWETSERQ